MEGSFPVFRERAPFPLGTVWKALKMAGTYMRLSVSLASPADSSRAGLKQASWEQRNSTTPGLAYKHLFRWTGSWKQLIFLFLNYGRPENKIKDLHRLLVAPLESMKT